MATQLLHVQTVDSETTERLEEAILELVNEETMIGLDTLLTLMPQYSWNQIFHSVDRLARGGKLVLRRYGFGYSLFSAHYAA
jgi:hypothetical protein